LSAEAGAASFCRTFAGVAAALLFGTGALFPTVPSAQAQQQPAPGPVAPSPSVVGRDVLQVDPSTPDRKPKISVTPSLGLNLPPDVLNREVEYRSVLIEGATAFKSADIEPLFASVLNRRVKFSEVVTVIDRITAIYQQGGYAFYSVVLPQQDLGGDRLHVIVIEGAIAKIEIDPAIATEKARERITELLAPLIGRRLLRKAELERRLLLAADTPGAVLTANARPTAGDPTKVDLVIGGKFERFQPIAQLDDFQTTPDTSVNFRVGGIGRSLLTGGDALELRYLFALPWNSLNLVDARYGLPVGNDGGRLSLLGQAVWQRPLTTINGQTVDYLAQSLLGRLQYSHPVVRTLNWTLMGFAMVDVIEVDYYLLGFHIPGDSLRVLRGGTTTAVTDDLGAIWTASALASVGLGVADAAANNRFSATPTFFKANLALERIQPIGKTFAVLARATGQLTSGTVPASEVFAYGGRDYGRAFVVAQSFGDRGAAVAGEIRYTPDWLGIDTDIAQPQLYAFADHAWLSSTDPRNAPYFYEGSSAGGGLRVRALQKWTGEVEFAQGFGTQPVDYRPWRINFRIGTVF
jgi:hemolysin activation/secretion protein